MPSYKRISPRGPITCRYLIYQLPNGEYIHLPLINVRLESDEGSLTTVGLVDSGSTVTFVPYEIAEMLALPHVEEEAEAIGAGGTFPTFTAKVKCLSLIKGLTIFSEFSDLEVHVPREAGRVPYVVLGRDSVFDRFHVTFQEKRRRVILRHHKWPES